MKLTKKAASVIFQQMMIASMFYRDVQSDPANHSSVGQFCGYQSGVMAFAEVFNLNTDAIIDFIHGELNVDMYKAKTSLDKFLEYFGKVAA